MALWGAYSLGSAPFLNRLVIHYIHGPNSRISSPVTHYWTEGSNYN